jgi:hypothetical protein
MLALALALTAPLGALAQGQGSGRTCPGRGQGPGRGGRMFDARSTTMVQGDVVRIEAGEGHRGQGVHLILAVGSENLEVMVGPSFFLDQQSLKLAQGDRIEVKGSRSTWEGSPALVAQEIRKGNEVLTLRDADGVPLWARGKRGT